MENIKLRVGETYRLPTVQTLDVVSGHPSLGLILNVLAEGHEPVRIEIPIHWELAQELSALLKSRLAEHQHMR